MSSFAQRYDLIVICDEAIWMQNCALSFGDGALFKTMQSTITQKTVNSPAEMEPHQQSTVTTITLGRRLP
ncbi:MAG: hypothetical protein PHU06_10550 [Gallionella sp.]|nr:hypothetical protein [Gallionella sp.]